MVFRKLARSEIKEFYPADVKRFRFTNSKYFVSKEVIVNGDKVALFLEFLIDGTVDLYSFDNGISPRFFIQKNDGETQELMIKKQRIRKEESSMSVEKFDYMSTLKSIMADSPRFFPAIDKTAFETQSLIMLVKRYNNYVSSSGSVFYEQQPPDVKITFGPLVSYNSSTLDFNHSAIFEAIDFQNSGYPSIGALMDISLPKSNRTFSFQTSVSLGQSKFYGTGINPIKPSIFEEVYYKTLNLKGKLGLKYTYPKGMVRPTLLISGNIIYFLNREGRRVEDNKDNSTIYINESYENIMAKSVYGYDIEVGIDFHFSKTMVPFISAGYSRSSGNNKGADARIFVTDTSKPLTTILKTFNINAGIYF